MNNVIKDKYDPLEDKEGSAYIDHIKSVITWITLALSAVSGLLGLMSSIMK